MASLLHYVLVEKESVSTVTSKHPEFTGIVKELFPQDEQHYLYNTTDDA